MARAFETRGIQCNIRGQGRHTAFFHKITAPEYLIIQSIHGKGSCEIKEIQGDDHEIRMSETSGKMLRRVRSPESLQEKLISKYTEVVFKKVFPGENPVLPFTYEDANLLQEQNVEADEMDGWEEMDMFTGDDKAKAQEKPKSLTLPPKAKTEPDTDLIGKKA